MVDMSLIRKCAKETMGSIKSELKVKKGLYFFQCSEGVGYVFSLKEYPLLTEVCNKHFLIEGEMWGIAYQGFSYLKVVWLYPDVIDALKTNVNVLKQYRSVSKAEYRRVSLQRAYETLLQADKSFLDRHPETMKYLEV